MPPLSISGRIIEVKYRYCEMSLAEFLKFAKECGYDGVELRATQITSETTVKQAEEFRKLADELNINISSCMVPGISADEEGLKSLERFISVAKALRCNMLKVWIGDVEWIKRACDLLEPHNISLIVQTHIGGPFETLDSSLETLEKISRKNFGLQYDPSHFFVKKQDYGEKAVKKLGKNIFQISIQNIRPAEPDEPDVIKEKDSYYARCLVGDPRGLDYKSVFKGLKEIGFDGYIVLNEPKPKQIPLKEFAIKSAQELRKLWEN